MSDNRDTWNSIYTPAEKELNNIPNQFEGIEGFTKFTDAGKGFGFKSYDGKEWPTLKMAMEHNERFLKSMMIKPDSSLYDIDGRTTDLYDIENRSR